MYVETLQMWFEISVFSPMPEHFVVVFDMINDRKIAEEELREKQSQLDAAVMEVAMAEEKERRRIASDLHDQVGQSLILSRIKLAMLSGDPAYEQVRDELDEISGIIGQALQDVRTLTFQISPPLLNDIGLKASLGWLANKMRTDYGLAVNLSGEDELLPIGSEHRSTVYRAVRELLINVAKHADTMEASIHVDRIGDTMSVKVKDGGCGFDISQVGKKLPRDGGFGLIHMRRRIEHLGGRLDLDSTQGAGTVATITMPLDDQQEGSLH
jgi:signal transduction histidine kinase